MPIPPREVPQVAQQLLDIRVGDMPRLDLIQEATLPADRRRYSWLPPDTPSEVVQIAHLSDVNFLPLIVRSAVQSLFVDGFRTPGQEGDLPVWTDGWQANQMDRRQIGVHTAAVKYGLGYSIVLPGDPVPVITTASPRQLTAVYAEDDDLYPRYALQKRRDNRYRLIDDKYVHNVRLGDLGFELIRSDEHNMGVCPVTRFLPDEDLDTPVMGVVEPHLSLQQQINFTTFGLLTVQHFGAFRQRYIVGWLADSEETRLKTSVSKFMTFEDSPDDIHIGEFQATDLRPYIDSRESTVRYLSAIAQTPAHELLGQLVNLSAEALAASQDSRNRLAGVMRTCLGEYWEQTLSLASRVGGLGDIPPSSYVWWRDTEPRSLAQTADALGKLATMLGIPPEALWEKVPGATLQEVQKWAEIKARQPDPEPEPVVPPVPAV